MTLDKAKVLITSINHNLDGRMKYTYEVITPESFKLKMDDRASGMMRCLTFELKIANGRSVDVEFTCHGFNFNFPLKKNISHFTFNLNDFELLITYGIKVDENCLHPELDLDVEF